ncbi:MAG: hypothetical protein A3D46_00050 [Candidatus Nealsonbacteria bacterium RIFCSPHIGHO2_02_FULL_43_13]|uniref:DUF1573 domain-containing protein n=1 Tax=Candidatus Nealsonbacteria bacterium RIFCSPHIGHO2_02_FULL_43_13 TaxID=1801668 RepID=A0A1G2E6U7_9BACT|nr:MAG: hypothetical protein A3D46_00050 [Candidatus Nealsonbacteria bacterium RIFCSPHIGHO2_02_FULL_43_13]
MKTKIVFVLVLVVLGLAGYGYFKSIPGIEPGTGNLPQIEITPKSFDFGEVQYGDIAEYSFKIKNTGSEILEIKRLATSCGCTSAKIAKVELNPGEEADLRVTYDSGAMSGPHGKGEQERIIYVKSSDPVNPQVEVMVYANVR